MPSAPGPAWAAPVLPMAAPAGARSVTLRCCERAPVRVRGPGTGRTYEFSAAKPTQPVDARDAEALLRTRLFVRG